MGHKNRRFQRRKSGESHFNARRGSRNIVPLQATITTTFFSLVLISCNLAPPLLLMAFCPGVPADRWHRHAGPCRVEVLDGKHSIDEIPGDGRLFCSARHRTPLPDWKARAAYYCRRIEQFHAREFGGQSKLTTVLRPEPLHSVAHHRTATVPETAISRSFKRSAKRVGLRQGERKALILPS